MSHRVEALAGSRDLDIFAAGAFGFACQRTERGLIGNDAIRAGIALAGNRSENGGFLFGFQLEAKESFARRERCRGRREFQARPAEYVVQPAVSEYRGISVDDIRQSIALARALGAAHLEDVGEVRVELEEQRKAHRLQAVVQNAQVFVVAGGA